MTEVYTTTTSIPNRHRVGDNQDLEANTTVTTPYTKSKCKGEDLCCCIGAMGTMLIFVAICVSSLCFFVSGAVFLAEEYTHIPDCASSYKGWGIAMTVIYGSLAFRSVSSTSSLEDIGFNKPTGAVFGVFAIFTGLIAGLGHRDVLQHSDNCDVSSIGKLETWTWWIVIYNLVQTILLLVGMLICCVYGE